MPAPNNRTAHGHRRAGLRETGGGRRENTRDRRGPIVPVGSSMPLPSRPGPGGHGILRRFAWQPCSPPVPGHSVPVSRIRLHASTTITKLLAGVRRFSPREHVFIFRVEVSGRMHDKNTGYGNEHGAPSNASCMNDVAIWPVATTGSRFHRIG